MSPYTPLLSPTAYFGAKDDRFAAGLVVLCTHGFVALFSTVVLFQQLFSRLDDAVDLPSGVYGIATGSISFGLVIGTLVGWLVVAAIMHVPFSEGSGSYRDALAVSGWAYGPNLLVAPIGFVHGWLKIDTLSLSSSDPAAIQREL